jgi:hypothetical protein
MTKDSQRSGVNIMLWSVGLGEMLFPADISKHQGSLDTAKNRSTTVIANRLVDMSKL